ncbi:TonB-dependent receptor [Rhizorhabdus argentea]|uniref:TonB-dependent receptor n=1 Tax=Rhizorhabdus argentea TaxID=1387174 RepID=UPI0030ECD233
MPVGASTRRIAASLICGITPLLAAPVGAQEIDASTVAGAPVSEDGSSGKLDEILVTARKQAESLIDVPVAVSALSAADIGRYNASNLSQIVQNVPQVTVEKVGGGGSGAIFVIRGIGSSPLDTGVASTVAINIDGTQISRGGIAAAGFFDLAQVEILKGPQALFFGKNSPAGVISLKSAGATKTLQGYARAGYEFNAREAYAEGAISGPISDKLGFRVAGRYSGMRGYERVGGVVVTPMTDPLFPNAPLRRDRSPRRGEALGRLTLEWNPSDAFTAVLKVLGDRVRDKSGANSTTEVVCADPNGKPIAVDFATGVPFVDPAGDCRANGRRSSAALNATRAQSFPHSRGGQPYLRFDAVVASLNANYRTDALNLTSITSFYKYRSEFLDNIEFSSSANFFAFNRAKSSDFSQELRGQFDLSDSVNAVIGGFYEHESFPFANNVLVARLGLDADTGRFDNFSGFYDTTATTYSGFGQLNIDVLENLQLTGGARYTRQTTKTRGGNDFVSAIFGSFGFSKPAGELMIGDSTDDDVSPEATLNWHPVPNTTLYAAYKTGFKSGGFAQANVIAPSFTAASLRFKPEKAKGTEIGFKGEFFARRVRLASTAYRYTFNDLQVQNFDAATVSQQIRNAASARTTGVELEVKVRAAWNLELHGSGSYNRAKYVSYQNAPCYAGQTVAQGCATVGGVASQSLGGRSLARAPRVSLTGGFVFDTPVSEQFGVQFTGDVRYSSSYYNVETLNPTGKQDAFASVNASIRIHHPDDRWELALLGQNLTNRHYIVNAFDKPLAQGGQVVANVARGRQAAIQGTVKF